MGKGTYLQEDGRISIDLFDLLDSLDEFQIGLIADYLSCQESVITNVADQIIEGWTKQNSHGATGEVLGFWPSALNSACLEVAKRSGETARRVIENIEKENKRQRQENADLRKMILDMKNRMILDMENR